MLRINDGSLVPELIVIPNWYTRNPTTLLRLEPIKPHPPPSLHHATARPPYREGQLPRRP